MTDPERMLDVGMEELRDMDNVADTRERHGAVVVVVMVIDKRCCAPGLPSSTRW